MRGTVAPIGPMRLAAVAATLVMAMVGCGTDGPAAVLASTDVVEPGPGTGPPGGPPVLPSGLPVHVVAGSVTVMTAATRVGSGEPIVATVANGLDRTIYVATGGTDCSIVTLERRTDAGWQAVPGCLRGLAPSTLPIAPGLGLVARIDPRGTNLADANVGPGVYRIACAYGTVAGPDLQATGTAYSTPFLIAL